MRKLRVALIGLVAMAAWGFGGAAQGALLPHAEGGDFSAGAALNDAGVTVGLGNDGVSVVGLRWNVGATPLVAEVLPPLPGNSYSAAYGVNSAGLVVGESGAVVGEGEAAVPDRVNVAVYWTAGAPVQLPAPAGNVGSYTAYSVNDSNQIVGESVNHFEGATVAVLWGSASPAADVVVLHQAGWEYSSAYYIHADGIIVGEARPQGEASQGVVWVPDGQGGYTVTLLPPEDDDVLSVAFGVAVPATDPERSIKVVGETQAANGTVRGIVWTLNDEGDLDGAETLAANTSLHAINDLSVLVGYTGALTGSDRAASWHLSDLSAPTELAEAFSQAYAVNNFDEAVGMQDGQALFASERVKSVSLTAAPASPRAAGVPITFTAAAFGGSGNYEYRFWLKTGPTWAIVQPYSGSAQYLWDTTGLPNGTYFVQVDVRNAGTTVVRDVAKVVSFTISNAPPITAVALTADPASPQLAGAQVTFTAVATGGGDNVEYRFWLRTGPTWAVVQNYGASNTFVWNTSGLENGTYYIQVDARAAGTGVAREASKVLAYVIDNTPPITALDLVADPASPQVAGPSVTFTATPTGGSGNIEYRFWLRTGTTWAIVQNYGASNTWEWPTAAVAVGTYFVQVDARNVGSPNARDIAKVLRYDIVAPPPPPATGVSLVSDLPSPQVAGTAVTFTAAGQGGSGDYQYRFWLKTGPTWAVVQNYGAADTWQWMTGAAAPGTYFVQVDVRSAGSTANRDAARVMSFVIE